VGKRNVENTRFSNYCIIFSLNNASSAIGPEMLRLQLSIEKSDLKYLRSSGAAFQQSFMSSANSVGHFGGTAGRTPRSIVYIKNSKKDKKTNQK
jgi:hypothetical protein